MYIPKQIKKIQLIKKLIYTKHLFRQYHNLYKTESLVNFYCRNIGKIKAIRCKDSNDLAISKLLDIVSIDPVENDSFFYSIDPYKGLYYEHCVFDNFTIDYSPVINSSLNELRKKAGEKNDQFAKSELIVIDAIEKYIDRVKNYAKGGKINIDKIKAIDSLIYAPAKSFYEAMQRILIINQILWQTSHKLNGLGHLDELLIDLYLKDIREKNITPRQAEKYIEDFFYALHEYFWYKSSALPGDTGQIIILGGMSDREHYRCNELTTLFIKIAGKLKLPDPKILLRVSNQMPETLIEETVKCIGTGIGEPLLSNDDRIIPALIEYGYSETDAYNYVTSACWEPLMLGNACEANNIASFNFYIPMMEMFSAVVLDDIEDMSAFMQSYYRYLKKYTDNTLKKCEKIIFNRDALISLFSDSAYNKRLDFVQGGAVYNNRGLTSVGMATVVNSIINIKEYVFDKQEYTLDEIKLILNKNFKGHEELQKELTKKSKTYGCDQDEVIKTVSNIMEQASAYISEYNTTLGGKYKFGLSSPAYISDAKNMPASFDGRCAGMPFGVHISGKNGTGPTELLSFASKLNYEGNRINGNVVDIILSPKLINEHPQAIYSLIKGAIILGVYQMQFNVVDSKTLIAAREKPDLYPNLVVRVWGFSAYFNDLPDEYKQVLIERAIESEKAT